MAAAFKVTNSNEIATAFAAHDEFLSRVAMKANDGEAMTKGDDFYTAPFELLRKDNDTAFIVFTCYKTRSPHYEASDEMGDDAPLVAPGSIHMREIFDVKETDQFKFREYAWSMGNDVSVSLEDNAVEVICKAMGWELPTNWREVRTKQSIARRAGLAPIWDLVKGAPSGPNLHPPTPKDGIPGMKSCYTMKEGEDVSSFIANMFGDITQRPQDHLAAWKKKNAM